jgi:hypothetical protein
MWGVYDELFVFLAMWVATAAWIFSSCNLRVGSVSGVGMERG